MKYMKYIIIRLSHRLARYFYKIIDIFFFFFVMSLDVDFRGRRRASSPHIPKCLSYPSSVRLHRPGNITATPIPSAEGKMDASRIQDERKTSRLRRRRFAWRYNGDRPVHRGVRRFSTAAIMRSSSRMFFLICFLPPTERGRARPRDQERNITGRMRYASYSVLFAFSPCTVSDSIAAVKRVEAAEYTAGPFSLFIYSSNRTKAQTEIRCNVKSRT